MMDIRGYYFITDRGMSRAGVENDVKNALAAGVRVIQYREKNLSARFMCREAEKLRRLCRKAVFLVNDRVDVALASKADGVHLGQDDMPLDKVRLILGPKAVIGVTVHTLAEAREAIKAKADYLGVSPIFKTATKADAGMPAGIDLIGDIRKITDLPLVAIGGITLENAPQVIAAGADALCAISAVLKVSLVRQEIEKFQRLFGAKRGEK